MDISKAFAISASILITTGLLLCSSKKTAPVGIGVIAGGLTHAFFALLTLLL